MYRQIHSLTVGVTTSPHGKIHESIKNIKVYVNEDTFKAG
jgi:hypothetical protein